MAGGGWRQVAGGMLEEGGWRQGGWRQVAGGRWLEAGGWVAGGRWLVVSSSK